MESASQHEKKFEETKNKSVTSEIASDRESSIESFHTNKSEPSNTTETELIDLDDIELSDEESWLYKSPKKVTSDEKSANTQKWLQKNIDDMDDIELKATRTALLSKLNQLKLLNSSIEERQAGKDVNRSKVSKSDAKAEVKKTPEFAPITDRVSKLLADMSIDDTSSGENPYKTDKNCSSISEGRKSSLPSEKSRNGNDVFDLLDVQKIARLQEESLKQSTSKFLDQAGKRTMSSKDLVPTSPVQIASLNKPASVEGLNTCADKLNQSTIYSSLVPLHNMKKQSMFNSSSALNCNPEFHRGSLPNINKGYYSLKSKKPKRPSDPKVSCPLPIYPAHSKASLNGTMPQDSDTYVKSRTPSVDHRDSRTLPSSYRVNSRSNSSSRRETSAMSPSPRRESTPLWGSNSSVEPNPRENYRKFSSPVPSSNGYSRYCSNSPSAVSPTKTFNSLPKNLRSPSVESQRRASHSPSRRLPLSTVQHQSPKRGNSLTSPRNGEIRSLKAPSKIPSPASRSGIPVPSTTHISKGNEDDGWSQDCF